MTQGGGGSFGGEGWYPDPSPAPGAPPGTVVRWWDGRAWTHHTHQVAPAWPVAPAPEPEEVLPPAVLPERRLLRAEVLVVLAVGILGSTVDALALLTRYLLTHRQTTDSSVFVAGHTAVDVVVQVVLAGAGTMGIALVWYVLQRTNESFATIGFTRRHLVRDGFGALGLAFLMLILAAVVSAVLRGVGVGTISKGTAHGIGVAYLPSLWAESIRTGLIEELFVTGFLLHRLRQLGWSDRKALGASLAVRCSYHVYGGVFLVVFTFSFGWILARIWQRTNRLTLVVLTHIAYDGILFTLAATVHPHAR